MRIALALIAVVSAFVPLIGLGAPAAHACSCAPFAADEQGIRAQIADPNWDGWTFATAVTESSKETGPGEAEAVARVERVYRGSAPETVTLRGEGLGGSCDYVPEAGTRAFLVMREESGVFRASLCGSVLLGAAGGDTAVVFEDALAAIGGDPPSGGAAGPDAAAGQASEDDDTQVPIWAILLSIVALGVLLTIAAVLFARFASRRHEHGGAGA